MTEVDDPLVIPTDGDTPADRVEWLWPPYLSRGSLLLLDGDPGVGKSYITLDLAARLTAGQPMPDGSPSPAPQGCRVLVANGDDVVEETLLPRFLAAGGVRQRISFFGGLSRRRPRARVAEFPRDFTPLVNRIRQLQPVGLAVFDPFSVLFPRVAMSSDQAVREALSPFARLASITGVCFLFVRHLNKTGGWKSLYRGSGSIGLSAAVRTSLLAGRHPDDPDRAILSMPKANLGPRGQSLCYRIGEREGGVGVVWEGPTNLTADDLCRLKASESSPGQRAERWLKDLLANGPMPATRVEADAQAVGIGYATLRAMKKKLGVESRRVSRDGRVEWEWVWPVDGLTPLEPL